MRWLTLAVCFLIIAVSYLCIVSPGVKGIGDIEKKIDSIQVQFRSNETLLLRSATHRDSIYQIVSKHEHRFDSIQKADAAVLKRLTQKLQDIQRIPPDQLSNVMIEEYEKSISDSVRTR